MPERRQEIRVVNQEELATGKAEAAAKAIVPEAKSEAPALAEKEKCFRRRADLRRFSVNDKNLRAFYGDWFKNIRDRSARRHHV